MAQHPVSASRDVSKTTLANKLTLAFSNHVSMTVIFASKQCPLWGDSVEKLRSQTGSFGVVNLDKRPRLLRSAHFAAIHVKLSHFPKGLGGSGKEELVIGSAGATQSQAI